MFWVGLVVLSVTYVVACDWCLLRLYISRYLIWLVFGVICCCGRLLFVLFVGFGLRVGLSNNSVVIRC